MKRKILATLLFTLAALPATAQDFGGVVSSPWGVVAQMSREERQALRERWEEATPEERARIRRSFQDRLRMNAQEQPDQHWVDTRHGRGVRERAESGMPMAPGHGGFGMGYEQRRFDGRYPLDDEAGDGGRDGGGYGGGSDRRGRGRR